MAPRARIGTVAIIQRKIMLIPRRYKAWNGMEWNEIMQEKFVFRNSQKKPNKNYSSVPQK